MKLLSILLIAIWSHAAFAQSLFNEDVCPVVESAPAASSAMIFKEPMGRIASFGAFGLSCQDLKGLSKASEYASISLTSASVAMRLSPSLGAELAAAGLATVGSTAIIGIGLVGAVGFSTVYIVLKSSMEDCEAQDRDDLRDSIVRELEQKYDLHPNKSDVPMQIQSEGNER